MEIAKPNRSFKFDWVRLPIGSISNVGNNWQAADHAGYTRKANLIAHLVAINNTSDIT